MGDAPSPPAQVSYGATDIPSPSPTFSDVTVPTNADPTTHDIRQRNEILFTFIMLRRKYRVHILFYLYIVIFTGTAPAAVYLFLTESFFADWYIRNAHVLHATIQSVNAAIFYLFLASGFNLRLLFSVMHVGDMLGNLLIAICTAALFAVEMLDQVAIYLNLGLFDTKGVFHGIDSQHEFPLVHQAGMSPDSPVISSCFVLSILSSFMVFINMCHFLYYVNAYQTLVGGNMNAFRDRDGLLYL